MTGYGGPVQKEVNNLSHLFQNNRRWASQMKKLNPGFFRSLKEKQAPEYLWIGCSDSRVPANEIVGLLPGELFVHRNVGNLVIHTDMNCLSVIQYAVDFLKVRHIIVCGHYGCGGVKTALDSEVPHGLIDNWLFHIRDIFKNNPDTFKACHNKTEILNRLCELNVAEQVLNVGNTTVIQGAWRRGQKVSIHGWIYDVADGLIKILISDVNSIRKLDVLQKN